MLACRLLDLTETAGVPVDMLIGLRYATLSAHVVCFVRPSHEFADIQKHLRAFLAQPELFARMGERGREILEQHHTPEDYARAVTNLVELAQNYRPLAAMKALTMRSSIEMSAWLVRDATERERLESITKKHSLIYGRSASGKKIFAFNGCTF